MTYDRALSCPRDRRSEDRGTREATARGSQRQAPDCSWSAQPSPLPSGLAPPLPGWSTAFTGREPRPTWKPPPHPCMGPTLSRPATKSPTPPWALPALGLSSSSVDALTQAGKQGRRLGDGIRRTNLAFPFFARPPSRKRGYRWVWPRQTGVGAQGWTPAGWHGTSLMDGTEQGLVQDKAHTLSFRSPRGPLQLLLPAAEPEQVCVCHKLGPHPVSSVGHTGRPQGSWPGPRGSRSKAGSGRCTPRTATHRDPLRGASGAQ